jgi:pimeloyl-ACP methyl ester carboxylesterase
VTDLWIVAGLVALGAVALGWLHLRFWTRYLAVETPYSETVRVPTPDGSAFELRRLDPPPTPEAPPILLVHGLAANHRNVDPEPDHSLARFLAERGRDVWLLTLRSGRADKTRAERKRMRFAAMVEHDLPLAIEEVCRRTESDAVDYVGFSMGGMLVYAGLGRTVPETRIRRFVAIGSPGRLVLPIRWLTRFFRLLPRFLVPSLWLRLAARMSAFLIGLLPIPLEWIVFNRANVPEGKVARALVNLIEDIPGPLSADFNEWVVTDGELRMNGDRVLDRLTGVGVPALFFAGAGDRIAPPECVRVAYDAWGKDRGAVQKEYRLLGKDEGAAEDYGHGDLAIGRHLPDDLFSPTAAFLEGA